MEETKKLVVESSNTKFYLYKHLSQLAPNSWVTNEKCAFVVEIDAEENRKLVGNIQDFPNKSAQKNYSRQKKRTSSRSWKPIFKNKII